MNYFLGIDVGTGSARAGLFDEHGRLAAMAKRDIRMWHPTVDHYQQSSADIWRAVCAAARACLSESGVAPADVKGVGFDATCSLVVLDASGEPVSVSRDGDDAQNVIVWMDHRALAETDEVNGKGPHEVFDFVGGKISPEMQLPKLLWLKRHLPQSWARAGHFFDLPDFLTFRATGQTTRSLCSTVCKWTYLGHKAEGGASGWQDDFLQTVGLGDLVADDHARIGSVVRPIGEAIPGGLGSEAAAAFGLVPGTPVGVSLIDAHAGGVGMLGLAMAGEGEPDFDRRLALIGGTSSCHMTVSRKRRGIPGVWGPYFSAMLPDLWLNEGGQSATGSLLDHVVSTHAAYAEAQGLADRAGQMVFHALNDRLANMSDDGAFFRLTETLHVCPYFHGNRSPRANPRLRGMISGLTLSAGLDELCALYLATMQAIAYGTRHIVESMNAVGYAIDTIVACGGGTKNPVFLQQHADATGCRIVLPAEPEAVLLGAAVLGACASGGFDSLPEAMRAMSASGSVIEPVATTKDYHDRKYRVFQRMYEDQVSYAATMGVAL